MYFREWPGNPKSIVSKYSKQGTKESVPGESPLARYPVMAVPQDDFTMPVNLSNVSGCCCAFNVYVVWCHKIFEDFLYSNLEVSMLFQLFSGH